MKRWIGFLTALVMLLTASGQAAAAYIPPGDAKTDGAENILLVYAGYYNPDNYDGQQIGEWDKDKFLPYVGHLTEHGTPDDFFYDTYLFLGLKTPLGGDLHRYYTWVTDSHPGTKADWQWVMDRMFEKDRQFDALNQAVKTVGNQLHDPDKQVNVYMVLPFPDSQSTEFGDIDGDGAADSLASLDNRNLAVKWYVDQFIERFRAANYDHLKLSGFYWMQEDLDTSVPGELDNVHYAVQYLHEQGLKLGWIPWSGAGMKGQGNSAGFDFTIIQPNHYMNQNTTIDRIRDTAQLADSSGEGVEIEFTSSVLDDPWYEQALRNYLAGGVMYGYMNGSLKAYYQDVYALYDLYHSDNPKGRDIYDDVYHFSKGQYQPPTGTLTGRVVDPSGQPIPDAEISVDGREAVSDASGNYQIADLYAVQHTFTVRKEGYRDLTGQAQIAPGQTTLKDWVLAPDPVEQPDDPKLTIDDFEGSALKATADNPGKVSLNTDPQFVSSGSQSLKADYTTQFSNFRVYLTAGSSYGQTDWSGYDSVTADVYNPSDLTQYVDAEFMDQAMQWSRSYSKTFELAPHAWTKINVPIKDMDGPNFNIHDVRRMSFNQKLQAPYHLPNTLYIDNVHLVKYSHIEQAPNYRIVLPNSLMDLGQSFGLQVVDANDSNRLVPAEDVQYSVSDPNVLNVSEDGTLTALAPGVAMVRVRVQGIDAESVKIEVSRWTKFDLKPQDSQLQVGQVSQITAVAKFESGFTVPFPPEDVTWKVKGDGIQVTEQTGAKLSFQVVAKGVVCVEATLQFNGKTMTSRTKLLIQ
ncbi:DUF4855 domain-containing protein [Cohnella zeiphila]|uniref:DUF4855 domain-containing protein n=1 Tax=Cohnella zeiphila TaxID=2761120 RepID=A0A7X0SMS4_9BACL|nr:DUF4855 domain-containing protein [Cohnella zeiphila]MBB6732739.1 DUF4855 domain-containing protein [Cohnella zeiphila]